MLTYKQIVREINARWEGWRAVDIDADELEDYGTSSWRATFAASLLERHMEPERAKDVAKLMATGTWTHDHPLLARELKRLGLPVTVGVPERERELMTLYPRPRGRPSPVEYVPAAPPVLPGRRTPR